VTLLAAVIGALTIQAPTGAGPVPAPPSLIDNATLTVSRVHVAPGGALVLPRTMPPLLVVFLDEGEAQIAQGNENGRARHPSGSVTFVPKDGSYEAGNKGARPFDLLVVAIKTMRPAAPAAPATEAPPGITRTTLVDNGDVRVVRVRFAPGSREPVPHTPQRSVDRAAHAGGVRHAGRDGPADRTAGHGVREIPAA